CSVLSRGLPAGPPGAGEEERPPPVLRVLLVDLPDELLALLRVGLLRLLAEQLLQVLVAVVRVVALRAAGVVLIEALVGIVDAVAGQIDAAPVSPPPALSQPHPPLTHAPPLV